MRQLLSVHSLSTHICTADREVRALTGVTFSVAAGETLAIVGESGCGKSMTALSILRLLPPGGRIVEGSVVFEGTDLVHLNDAEMRSFRGNRIAMIFQEPMTSLNPVLTIGFQVAEGLRLHRSLSQSDALSAAAGLLGQVGIPSPEACCTAYPHQLSGGMRQRAMIAMAIACRPQLLIADEPTTALDVTIQAQILDLLNSIKSEHGMGMILISHDLGIVAENSQKTVVMYAGTVIESAATGELLSNPLHPYTVGLIDSLPQKSSPGFRLATIPGQVPDLTGEIRGCGFCDRCPEKLHACSFQVPPMVEIRTGHLVKCWKYS